MVEQNNKIFLFDVDGTLTPARNPMTEDMKAFLQESMQNPSFDWGIVSGSDLKKVKEQIPADLLPSFAFCFGENGLYAMKNNEFYKSTSIKDFLSEEQIKKFVNFCLHYIADLDIPVKRGTFVEFRTGMLNISPIGRNCSQEERDAFEAFDKEQQVRKTFIEKLKVEFPDLGLSYSIGGQISFDVFPNGWDKRFCLNHLQGEDGQPLYKEVHFWGDKTYPGGNDHEIFEDERTIGHTVKDYKETMQQVREVMEGS